jgi:hypothetical protein
VGVTNLMPVCCCPSWQLCVDVSDDGLQLLTSSKGFNSVGAEAKVRDHDRA